MNEMQILNALGQVDETYIEEAAPEADKPQTASPRWFRYHLSSAAMIGLLILSLLASGTVIAVYRNSIQNWFENYWKQTSGTDMSEGQRAVIDHLSQDISISQTKSDVTVTVDSATIGDDSFFLLLRVSGPKFSKRHSYEFDNVIIDVKPDPLKEAGGLSSFGFEYQGMDGDGSLLMLLNYDYTGRNGFKEDTRPLEITLNLTNFTQNGRNSDKRKLLCEETWDFSFILDRSSLPENISLPDTEVVVTNLEDETKVPVLLTNIELTNTGIRFQYDYKRGGLHFSEQISAILKNGHTVEWKDGGGSPLEDETTLACSYHWQVPLNLDEITAIRIGNVEIPID